jgi:hypothetical protein
MSKKSDKKARKAKIRGHANAGRPKAEGERYPNGRLKPRGGNPKVIEMRKALMGNAKVDLSKADNPIELAYARGWLTENEGRAAKTLENLYRQAGFSAPHMNSGGLSEVQPSLDLDARNFSIMSDAEVTEIWDKVMNDEGSPTDRELQSKRAMRLWCTIMGGMPNDVRAEVFSVCIAQSWPQWIIYLASAKEVPEGHALRRRRLLEGLGVVRNVMSKSKPKVIPMTSEVSEKSKPKGQKREEHFTYVDEDGATLLEVVKITRRMA